MSKASDKFKEYNKKYKEELFKVGVTMNKSSRIPFSSPQLNYLLFGGIPRGRLTEFAGPENSGKTTTSLDVVANAQKLFKQEYEEKLSQLESVTKPTATQVAKLSELRESGELKVLWVDCENTFDEDWARIFGVDLESLYFMAPQGQSAEEIFQMITELVETGEIGLVIIDSLGVMVSAQALKNTIEQKTYAGISGPLTDFSKKITGIAAKTNCAILGINQQRDNMNSTYGGVSTPGGKGWKHNCSVRLSFMKGDFYDAKCSKLKKSENNPTYHEVLVTVVKTKICKPTRKTSCYSLNYVKGIDATLDLANLCIAYNIIQLAGSWYSFINPETGEVFINSEGKVIKVQGLPRVVEYLETTPDMYEIYNNYINKIIEGIE